MKYDKPPLTFKEQINLLVDRGLIVNDSNIAEQFLRQVSYYRFSAYCIPFQTEKDKFNTGTTFEDIRYLYNFDRELRILIFEGIKTIEVSFRTNITYYLAHTFGAFGYLKGHNFLKKDKHQEVITNINNEIKRSRETFVAHYKNKYHKSKNLPVWMATELASFGTLSKLFNTMNFKDKKKIAKIYNTNAPIFQSWIHNMVYVRNLCAHHSRIWNRTLAIKPEIPNNKHTIWHAPFSINNSKIFSTLSVINFLLSQLNESYIWKDKLFELINNNPNIDYSNMGFPSNWKEHKIWRE